MMIGSVNSSLRNTESQSDSSDFNVLFQVKKVREDEAVLILTLFFVEWGVDA